MDKVKCRLYGGRHMLSEPHDWQRDKPQENVTPPRDKPVTNRAKRDKPVTNYRERDISPPFVTVDQVREIVREEVALLLGQSEALEPGRPLVTDPSVATLRKRRQRHG